MPLDLTDLPLFISIAAFIALAIHAWYVRKTYKLERVIQPYSSENRMSTMENEQKKNGLILAELQTDMKWVKRSLDQIAEQREADMKDVQNGLHRVEKQREEDHSLLLKVLEKVSKD